MASRFLPQTLCASMAALLLTFGIVLTPKEHSVAATPQPSPITLVQPDYQLWQKIPADLTYTPDNLKFASQAIAKTKSRYESVLTMWRSKGVVTVKKIYTNSMTDKRLSAYPEYSRMAKSYTLVGLNAKGSQLTKMEWPDRGSYSASRYQLVGIKADQCQLTSKNKSNSCLVTVPTTKDWLRISIVERVSYVEANSGTYWFTRDLVNVFNSQEPYTVRDGMAFSESIKNQNLVTGGLPLAAKVDIFNYKIEIGPDKWRATYTMSYMKPQQIADGLTKSMDNYGEIALTPAFKW